MLMHQLTTSGLDPRLEARWVSPPGAGVGGGLCVYSRYPVTAVEPIDGTRWPAVRLTFDVDTAAPQEKLDQLLKLTERYCVVYQTIKSGPPVEVKLQRT